MTRTWLLLAYGEDRLYAGNSGYDDGEDHYSYDSNVPNWKRLSAGDRVVIAGRTRRSGPPSAVGVAMVQRITSREGMKTVGRCPECKHPRYKERLTKSPRYRCDNGHEFDRPSVADVPVTLFTAWFGDSFRRTSMASKDLRTAQVGPRDGNAIRPLRDAAVDALFR